MIAESDSSSNSQVPMVSAFDKANSLELGKHEELPEIEPPGCLELALPKLAFPVAILAGCGITASTTYALVRHVQHLISSVTVNADPLVWMQEARTNAYDACYFGCDDCGDHNWAYNACARTAKANVTGVLCDGNRMWNFKDRYPLECLHAVGEFYKADALHKLKKSNKNLLALIILTVLAGILGAWVILKYLRIAAVQYEEKAFEARSKARRWPQQTDMSSSKKQSISSKRGRPGCFNRITLFFVAFVVLFGKTGAYSCAGHGTTVDNYFVNSNRTIFGVVHGWLSDCYEYDCNCYLTCSGGTVDNPSRDCTTTCSTCVGTKHEPPYYVNKTIESIERCGFLMTDAVEGDVNLRVPNALIERDLWVRISVNKFNVTDVTDPSIQCLHDIATA
jgi:hypothetical protein